MPPSAVPVLNSHLAHWLISTQRGTGERPLHGRWLIIVGRSRVPLRHVRSNKAGAHRRSRRVGFGSHRMYRTPLRLLLCCFDARADLRRATVQVPRGLAAQGDEGLAHVRQTKQDERELPAGPRSPVREAEVARCGERGVARIRQGALALGGVSHGPVPGPDRRRASGAANSRRLRFAAGRGVIPRAQDPAVVRIRYYCVVASVQVHAVLPQRFFRHRADFAARSEQRRDLVGAGRRLFCPQESGDLVCGARAERRAGALLVRDEKHGFVDCFSARGRLA